MQSVLTHRRGASLPLIRKITTLHRSLRCLSTALSLQVPALTRPAFVLRELLRRSRAKNAPRFSGLLLLKTAC